MSVVLYFKEGFYCPFFRCDVCKKRIVHGGLAMAAWAEVSVPTEKFEDAPCSHVHKGRCLEAFEAALPEGQILMTVELRDHYRFLGNNSLKKTA